jgi:HrpA-like RNA helicase
MVVAATKASCDQRAGRAGRIKPGKCYRLVTSADYEKLQDCQTPEIQRSNPLNMIVKLKSLGVRNILQFPYISPPISFAV